MAFKNFFSKSIMKKIRKRYNLNGFIEIHHVIPRQFSKHAVIKKYKYDTEESYNFVFCPSKKGLESMNLRQTRPNHSGGHLKYNNFVNRELDNCDSITNLYVLWVLLHLGCRGFIKIPWR